VTTPAQAVIDQYSTGSTRLHLERALLATGKDLATLTPADLAMLEDFHTMGRFATAALVAAAGIGRHDRVLDAGTGIGGTARFVAHTIGSHVTGVDLAPEYCDAAQWLTELVGLTGQITVTCANVCALPFPDASFDVVVSQHVQMNIADKAGLYGELRRVLAPGGRLALWDVVAGTGEPLTFPVPWANDPTNSHLVSSQRFGHSSKQRDSQPTPGTTPQLRPGTRFGAFSRRRPNRSGYTSSCRTSGSRSTTCSTTLTKTAPSSSKPFSPRTQHENRRPE